MEGATVQERRKFKRKEFREPVQFQFADPAQFGGSLAYDLSEGGIKMNFNDFVPLDTKIGLQVRLDSQKVIDCIGHVVWVQKYPHMECYQAGLEFDVMDPAISRTEIHEFINQQ